MKATPLTNSDKMLPYLAETNGLNWIPKLRDSLGNALASFIMLEYNLGNT